MIRSCCLVVNPAAGGGRTRRLLATVRGVLDDARVAHQVCASDSLEHARELAAAAAGRGDVAVAFGGDGMVGALAAAVAGADGVLGIIPVGRGNDFARTLGVPLRPADAARVLAEGRVRRVTSSAWAARGWRDSFRAAAAGAPAAGTPAAGAPADGAPADRAPAAGAPAAGADEMIVAGSVYLGIPAAHGRDRQAVGVPPGRDGVPGSGAARGAGLAHHHVPARTARRGAHQHAGVRRRRRRRGQLPLLRRGHDGRAEGRPRRRPARRGVHPGLIEDRHDPRPHEDQEGQARLDEPDRHRSRPGSNRHRRPGCSRRRRRRAACPAPGRWTRPRRCGSARCPAYSRWSADQISSSGWA